MSKSLFIRELLREGDVWRMSIGEVQSTEELSSEIYPPGTLTPYGVTIEEELIQTEPDIIGHFFIKGVDNAAIDAMEQGFGDAFRAALSHARSSQSDGDAGQDAPSLRGPVSAAASIAVIEGEDIYLDPPVRLLPQYDGRWKRERIAGPKTGQMLDWVANGCNASTAAMILRWFAEDCLAGSAAFPTKPDGSIDSTWYPLRMAEAFWPEADPPGKVELTPQGRIHVRKIYSVAAHYLKTGEIERRPGGNVIDQPEPTAHYVTNRPAEGWMSLIRAMLDAGPVIIGIGAPSGHFVVAHGIKNGGLLIADPGAVLYQAFHGGKGEIENWSGKAGYLDGTMDADQVRMPDASQWPGGTAPGQERDARSYHRISGQFLDDLFEGLISVISLTYREGARLS